MATAPAATGTDAVQVLTFVQTLRTFPRSFWMCCIMEMFERLAYYGVRVVMPIYIAQADEPGGLHFTQADKGSIFFWWALIQSLLPMFTGGIADQYGYKRTIFVTVFLKVIGYLLMATQRSYEGFFLGVVFLATGTALFKPGIQGTLAQSTSKQNSSVGWGLFYWLVNVGAAIGPPFAGYLHVKGWPFVFYGCAAIISLNLLMLFTYKDVDSGADKSRNFVRVMKETLTNILDIRLVAVIVIFSGFWCMLYQLWDLMPNFYADWIDSAKFVAANTWIPETWTQADPRGAQLKQENALNLNAVIIVLTVVPISQLVARLRVTSSITLGILIGVGGILVSGTTMGIEMLFVGIALFSLGEMLTGPKKTEYFSLIAPPGKKGLYLGYVNIPVALGQAFGAKMAGSLYGSYGEKATLALRYIAEKTEVGKARGTWNGDPASLAEFTGVARTEAFARMMQLSGLDAGAANKLLWDTYEPWVVWLPFAALGMAALVGMIVFARMSRRWKDMDV